MNIWARSFYFRSLVVMVFLLAFLPLPVLPAGMENPVVSLSKVGNKTIIKATWKPGEGAKTLATLNGEYGPGSNHGYIGDEEPMDFMGKGRLLLYTINMKTWTKGDCLLDLGTGKVTHLKMLFPPDGPSMMPDGSLVSSSSKVRISKDGRYALFFNLKNLKTGYEFYEGDAYFSLYDKHEKKIIWEKLFFKGDLSRTSLYAHFAGDNAFLFIKDMLYRLDMKSRSLSPLVKGAYFYTVDSQDTSALMVDRSDATSLFDFATLKARKDLQLPNAMKFNHPNFSSGGKYLAYSVLEQGVYVIDTTTGRKMEYAYTETQNPQPVFSPDGRQLYFMKDKATNKGTGRRGYRMICWDYSGGREEVIDFALLAHEYISFVKANSSGYWVTTMTVEGTPKRPQRLYLVPWGSTKPVKWAEDRECTWIVP